MVVNPINRTVPKHWQGPARPEVPAGAVELPVSDDGVLEWEVCAAEGATMLVPFHGTPKFFGYASAPPDSGGVIGLAGYNRVVVGVVPDAATFATPLPSNFESFLFADTHGVVAIHELGLMALGWDGAVQWAFDTSIATDCWATDDQITAIDDEGETWVAHRITGLVSRTPDPRRSP